MEYDTVKQKEKKISVKICKGNIWEELKENLISKKCLDEKKGDKKKLVVDVNVKREFRGTLKEESWVNRIKSALTRGRFQDQSDKKDSATKQQKKETSKTKATDKDKSLKEINKNDPGSETVLETDFVKEESQNVLSQTKKRLVTKDTEQSTSGLVKNKKNPKDNEPKEKGKNKENLKSSLAEGDSLKETDNYQCENGLKSSRQKGNKYEVQINNNVVVLNPNDIDASPNNSDEKLKKRQITKGNRSKSKPATAKEKWSESNQGKVLDGLKEPTLETIKDLKSSIISLRAVDKKLKTREPDDKPKESKVKRCDDRKKKKKDDDRQCTLSEISFFDVANSQREVLKTDKDDKRKQTLRKDCTGENRPSTGHKRRKDKKIKADSSRSSSEEIFTKRSSSTVKLKIVTKSSDPVQSSEAGQEGSVTDNAAHLINDILEERLPLYSSSCYTGSSSSEEHECSCGCMDSGGQACSKSDSSDSSSSLEYLRSYSGNLIMCAHGKKPVLNEHIRYLSSCIKL